MISLSQSPAKDPRFQQDFYSYEPRTTDAFLKVITSDVWSPIVWEGGKRLKKAFQSSSYMALDFDSGDPSLSDMAQFCQDSGVAHVIATTKSHRVEKKTATGKTLPVADRFRVIFKAESVAFSRELYEYNMGLLVSYFGADKSCTDAARFFYPCREIVSVDVRGRRLPWLPFDEDYVPEGQRFEARAARLERMAAMGIMPGWIKAILTGECRVDTERHATAYRISCNLARMGWEEDAVIRAVMKTNIGDIGEFDVRRCVENGFKAELG